MNRIKIIVIMATMLIGCFALTGCSEKNTTNVDSELIDALQNSNPSSGTIASNEKNTRISFFVMDGKIEVSGQYYGEEFETSLTDEKMETFVNEIVNYSTTVQEKENDYWPHTDEYPEMYVLFEYTILFDNEYKYRMDGAECYPDGWDEFIERIAEIIGL